MSDAYVDAVVAAHAPATSFLVPDVIASLEPHILPWANGWRYEVLPSGSFAKGTAIAGSSDVDLFISLEPRVGEFNTLENVYSTLRNRFRGVGYNVREQNVSLGLLHNGLRVDLVAGVQHHALGADHSIWRRKAQTWTKTNVAEHIRVVSGSGRTENIRAAKIWRKQKGLDFPSFFLELTVIRALSGMSLYGASATKFSRVMEHLATDWDGSRIVDPANTNNVVSEELSDAEKALIRAAAEITLRGNFEQAFA